MNGKVRLVVVWLSCFLFIISCFGNVPDQWPGTNFSPSAELFRRGKKLPSNRTFGANLTARPYLSPGGGEVSYFEDLLFLGRFPAPLKSRPFDFLNLLFSRVPEAGLGIFPPKLPSAVYISPSERNVLNFTKKSYITQAMLP